jgi:hypothetical protein
MYDLKLSGRGHEAELIQAVRERIRMLEPTPESSAFDAAKAATHTTSNQEEVLISLRHNGDVAEIVLPSTMLPNGILFEGSVRARFYEGCAPKVEMWIEPEVFDASINHAPTQMAVQSAVDHLVAYAAGSRYDPAHIEKVWVKGIPDNHASNECPVTEQIDAFVNSASIGEIRDVLVGMAKRMPSDDLASILSQPEAEHDPLAPGASASVVSATPQP